MIARMLMVPLVAAFSCSASAQVWTQKNDFGGAGRTRAAAFSIGGKGYLGTGSTTTWTKDFWEFDPATNTWAQKADVGTLNRSGAVGFSIMGKGYIGLGGSNGTYRQDLWQYDPATNTWTPRASLPAAGRQHSTVFVIGSKVYVCAGYNSASLQETWCYDPVLDTWTQRASLPGGPIAYAAGFAIGGKGYVCGGDNTNAVWAYDPVLDNWTACAPAPFNSGGTGFSVGDRGFVAIGFGALYEYYPQYNKWYQLTASNGPSSFSFSSAFTIGTKAYVATGEYSFMRSRAVFEVDPSVDIWRPGLDLPGPARAGASAFSVGGKGYVCAGRSGPSTLHKDLWEYDPTTDIWTQKADMPGAAREFAVAFAIGSKGYFGLGTTNDFWEYDPALDQWTQRASFPGFARSNAVAFAVGGKGYVTLGSNGTGFTDLWAYDPLSDTWTTRAAFPGTARVGAAAAAVGAQGYVVAGQSVSGDIIIPYEVWAYSPSSNSWSPGTSLSLPGGRTLGVAFSLNGDLFFGTGDIGLSSSSPMNDLWQYDLSTATWTRRANIIGRARSIAIAFSIGNTGYLATGYGFNPYQVLGDIQAYTPAEPTASLLNLRCFLEGPFDPGTLSMSDGLRTASLIPAAEPYSALGYSFPNGNSGGSVTPQVLATAGLNAIVDWVLLEVRDALQPAAVITRKCALVQRDGDVVATDGVSPLSVSTYPGTYYLAIRHRDHLGVMTAAPVALGSGPVLIDFTNPSTATYGTNAQKQVGAKMVLWAGDATGNGAIKYTGSGNDRDPIILAIGGNTPNNTVTNVYDRRDTNLDGVIKYTGSANDRDIILTNIGSTTPNNTRTQQLP